MALAFDALILRGRARGISSRPPTLKLRRKAKVKINNQHVTGITFWFAFFRKDRTIYHSLDNQSLCSMSSMAFQESFLDPRDS